MTPASAASSQARHEVGRQGGGQVASIAPMEGDPGYLAGGEGLNIDRMDRVVDPVASQEIGEPQRAATPFRADLDQAPRLLLPEQELVKGEIERVLVGRHALVAIAHRAPLDAFEEIPRQSASGCQAFDRHLVTSGYCFHALILSSARTKAHSSTTASERS